MLIAKKSIFLAALFIIFTHGSVCAGIDPFYKGDWGMGAAEIKTLNKVTPDTELGQMLVYTDNSDGVYNEIIYFFDNDALLGVTYLIKGGFAKEQELRRWLQNLDSLMVAPSGGEFTREAKEKKLDNDVLIFLYLWKNAETQVFGRVYVNTADKTFDLEFSFTNIGDPAVDGIQDVVLNSLDDVAQDIYDSFSK